MEKNKPGVETPFEWAIPPKPKLLKMYRIGPWPNRMIKNQIYIEVRDVVDTPYLIRGDVPGVVINGRLKGLGMIMWVDRLVSEPRPNDPNCYRYRLLVQTDPMDLTWQHPDILSMPLHYVCSCPMREPEES